MPDSLRSNAKVSQSDIRLFTRPESRMQKLNRRGCLMKALGPDWPGMIGSNNTEALAGIRVTQAVDMAFVQL